MFCKASMVTVFESPHMDNTYQKEKQHLQHWQYLGHGNETTKYEYQLHLTGNPIIVMLFDCNFFLQACCRQWLPKNFDVNCNCMNCLMIWSWYKMCSFTIVPSISSFNRSHFVSIHCDVLYIDKIHHLALHCHLDFVIQFHVYIFSFVLSH